MKAVIDAVADLEQQVASRTDEVLTEFLIRGHQAIEVGRLQHCPLCEQLINSAAVLARLKERIAADERITTARNLVAERIRILLDPVRILSGATERFINVWLAIIVGEPLPNEYSTTNYHLNELVKHDTQSLLRSHISCCWRCIVCNLKK
jgi:hypothetical protein